MTETTQVPAGQRPRLPIWLLFGFAIVVALLFGYAASASNSDSPEEKAIKACQTTLTESLRDPDSAEFEDVDAAQEGTDRPDGWLVEGNYRARNGFGGMVNDFFVCTTAADGTDAEFFTGESLTD
jgi:hypothetical protein